MNATQYWDHHFAEGPHQDLKAPHPFLARMLPRLQKGKVLDIAMGEGANAVYLAQKGFKVKGFDISAVGIDHAQKLARATNVTIEAQRADLDFYLLGLMEYDSVIMTFFRPPNVRYYTEIIRTLKQCGTLLVASHMDQEMTEPIAKEEAFRNHFFGANELLRQLTGLRILYYHEGLEDGRHVVECLAQKPLDRDAAKYNLFGMNAEGSKEQGKSKHMELAEKFFKK